MTLSADGSRLYTGLDRNADVRRWPVAVWDTGTGRRIGGFADLGTPFALAPDDSVLAYADGLDVVLASPVTGEERDRLSGHAKAVEHLAFASDGRLLASAASDGTVVVWRLADRRALERVELEGGTLAFGPDDEALYVQTATGVHAVDLSGERRYLLQVRPPDRREHPVGSTSRFPSPDGTALLADRDHLDPPTSTRLIEVGTGRTTDLGAFAWVGTEAASVSWRPDGRRIAAVDPTGYVRVVDRRTGRILARRQVDAADFDAWVAYTADGRSLLAGSDHGLVVLDAETLERSGPPLRFPGRSVAFAAAGPDPTTAVVLLRDQPTNYWDFPDAHRWALVDLGTGEALREGSVDTPIESAAVSPDGRRLALGGQPLVVVDLRSGEASTSSEPRAAIPQVHVHWAPDGSSVVSGGEGRVNLWDGSTGEPLGDVDIDGHPVFLPRSRTVLIASADGSAYEWDTSLEHALDVACRVAGGGLTGQEWDELLPRQPYLPTCV